LWKRVHSRLHGVADPCTSCPTIEPLSRSLQGTSLLDSRRAEPLTEKFVRRELVPSVAGHESAGKCGLARSDLTAEYKNCACHRQIPKYFDIW